MNKRPVCVTIIGIVFIAMGLIGIVYHFAEFDLQHPFAYHSLWVLLIRLLAVLGGAFLLRGRNWARWLLLAWMAFHVILSVFHSVTEVVIHLLLLAVIAYFLLRPRESAYFRDGGG